ncbi:MAG TPA: sigma-70 family RNA polymerase sigma factor [Phenylobacterium sp.]|nr:sigma-70 family RNA polymerase sigma factor [Phenylobacterium sp.]
MLYGPGQSEVDRQTEGASLASDDVRLIRRIMERDLRAFEILYRDYHPRLTRFLTNMLRLPHLVEEALNDTMMVVWKRPEKYNGASKVSTWIFAIAYRTALKARSRHDEPLDDQSALELVDGGDPEQSMGQRQVQAILLTAMDRLSAEHRAVLGLTYFHGAGYREIAEIMGCPVGTVKTRMLHARRYLKGMLAGRLGDWL